MDDLPLVAISLELPCNRPLSADRQALLRPAGIVEIDEAYRVFVGIGREDPHRAPPRPGLARLERRQVDDDVRSEQVRCRRPRRDPLDDACRQMVEEVDNPGDVQPLQKPGDLGPHTLQRLDLREQWIEDVRAHQRTPINSSGCCSK